MKSKPIVLLFTLLFSQILFARDTVRVGTFMLAPFMMESDDGKRTTGVGADFWRKFAGPQMGVDVEVYGPFPIKRALKLLEDGSIDVIPNMTKIPEREEKFLFSEVPLSEITPCIVVRKNNPLKKVTKQEDLYNLKMVHLDATYIPVILRHTTIKIEFLTGDDYFQGLIDMLEAGRVDAFIHINYFSLKYELMTHDKKDTYRILELPDEKIRVYCVFSKTERGKKFSDMFNTVNASLFDAHVYDSIAEAMVK
ncbi:MAG: substrate-binding periplasmic protein [Fibrobacterota bacterium]|nr:transporter substrate-binding domain-containing protein [Chitinispirillaceae bacterium]